MTHESPIKGKPPKSPKTQVVAAKDLNSTEINTMFALMQDYYQNISIDEFRKDLAEKNDVIILREFKTNNIVGFSTLKYFALDHIYKNSLGVFSGDTIVHQRYWGCTALQKSFLIQLCKLKVRHHGKKLYWFLISKGYKTYLLMANNFPVHYPRLEESTPYIYKKMMAEVYQQIYPQSYCKNTDIISNNGKSYSLKTGVAAPNDLHLQKFPRIKFFVEKNPHWQIGDELSCIAEMNYQVLASYMGKAMKKGFGLYKKQWIS